MSSFEFFFENPEEPIVAAALKNGKEWGYWADMQLRDPGGEHGGWFIEMGGLNLFNGKGKDGKVRSITGKYLGPSPLGNGYGRFLVKDVDGVDDGVYHVHVNNIDMVKAVLSDEYLQSLGRFIPAQKEGVVDLAQTRVDPITEQDLEDAKIEADKPKNLRKLAESRTSAGKKLGDLVEGDILFDKGNDRYGEVVSTTNKDGQFEPWVKWENNQITKLPDATPEAETLAWSESEPIAQEMAEPKKTKLASELKPGDAVFVPGWEENRVVQAVEPAGGGDLWVSFKTPGAAEPEGKIFKSRDSLDLVPKGKPKAAPKKAPEAPVIKEAPADTKTSNKKSAADLKKGDKVVIDGETYTVSGKNVEKVKGQVVGYTVEFKAEDGSTFEEDFTPEESFNTPVKPVKPVKSVVPIEEDIVDEPGTDSEGTGEDDEEEEEVEDPKGILIKDPNRKTLLTFAKELKRGDVLVFGKPGATWDGLFISAEPVPPANDNDTRKLYKLTIQRPDGSIASAVVDGTNGFPHKLEFISKDRAKKLNRVGDLKAAPVKETQPKTTATTTTVPSAPAPLPEIPTDLSEGTTGKLTDNVSFEVGENGRIRLLGRTFPIKDQVRELAGEVSRSGAGKVRLFQEKGEIDPKTGKAPHKAWVVEIVPQTEDFNTIGANVLKGIQKIASTPKTEAVTEGDTLSGSKSTKGDLGNGVSFEVAENGNIKLSGVTKDNSDAIYDSAWADGMPDLNIDMDEEKGTISIDLASDTDSNRAQVLNAIKSALSDLPEVQGTEGAQGTQGTEGTQGTQGTEGTQVSKDAPTQEQLDTIEKLVNTPGLLSDKDREYVETMRKGLNSVRAGILIKFLQDKQKGAPTTTTTVAPKSKKHPLLTEDQAASIERRYNLLNPDQKAQIKEALDSMTPENVKGLMTKIVNTLDNAELIDRMRKGMPVDDILAKRENKSVGTNLLFDLDHSPKEIAQKLATYKPTVNLDGTPIAGTPTTTTTTPVSSTTTTTGESPNLSDDQIKKLLGMVMDIPKLLEAGFNLESIESKDIQVGDFIRTPGNSGVMGKVTKVTPDVRSNRVEIETEAASGKKYSERYDLTYRFAAVRGDASEDAKPESSRPIDLKTTWTVPASEVLDNKHASKVYMEVKSSDGSTKWERVGSIISVKIPDDAGNKVPGVIISHESNKDEEPIDANTPVTLSFSDNPTKTTTTTTTTVETEAERRDRERKEHAEKVRREIEQLNQSGPHQVKWLEEIVPGTYVQQQGKKGAPVVWKKVASVGERQTEFSDGVPFYSVDVVYEDGSKDSIGGPGPFVDNTRLISQTNPEAATTTTSAPEKPEFFDPATHFPTPEQNNNAYWDWARESLKNKTISPEDLTELLDRLKNEIISGEIAAHAVDKDGNNVRSNVLKSNVLNYLQKNPEADLDEVLNVYGGVFDDETAKRVMQWGALLKSARHEDAYRQMRDSAQEELTNLATQYYNEAKAEKTTETDENPSAESLLENTVNKKVSEINVGDRVFDKASQSFATVIGVYQDPDSKFHMKIVVRFEDGTEKSSSFKKSSMLITYAAPESSSESSRKEKESAEGTETTLDDILDDQETVEQGESTGAEPGSNVQEEPDIISPEGTAEEPAAEEPVKPKRKPRGPNKPKRIDFTGVSDEDRADFIALIDALDNYWRVMEEQGEEPLNPKWYVDEKDRLFENKSLEEVASSNTKGIGEDLGIALMQPTMDSVDKDGKTNVIIPTPGAFTGRVARMVEGKTKAEIRDIINGLEVSWLDTETTGMADFDGDPATNSAVQVGVVKTKDGEVISRLNIFLNPGEGVKLSKWSKKTLVRDVLDKNGKPVLDERGKPKTEPITDEWLSEQMPVEDAVAKIIDFMGRDPIIGGQNVPFDLKVLQDMLDRAGVKGFHVAGTIDSKDIAGYLLPKYDPDKGIDGPKRLDEKTNKLVSTTSLGFVADFLGFEPTRWHSADGDAEDSWKIATAVLNIAAQKDPNGSTELADQDAMRKKYEEAMKRFVAAVDPSLPSTAKQHGAVRKNGLGDMLDDLGMPRDEQDKIFNMLRYMTRGEAAKKISAILAATKAEEKPQEGAKPYKKPLHVADIRSNLESLAKKGEVPLPEGLQDLGVVADSLIKQRNIHREGFSKFVSLVMPNVPLDKAFSDPEHREDLKRAHEIYNEWYKENVGKMEYRTFKVGNATIRFKEEDLPESSRALAASTMDYLQKNFPVGDVPVEITYESKEAIELISGESGVAGVAWTDDNGAHILINKEIIGKVEKDDRPGRTGYVSNELATLIHEYGHIYHEVMLGLNERGGESSRSRKFEKQFGDVKVTEYGESNTFEKFAEMFFDSVYSALDNEPAAIPEFTKFLESLKKKRPIVEGGLLAKLGIKKPYRKDMPADGTTPEFDGAVEITGTALLAYEQGHLGLRGTDASAGYIPDVNDEEAFQDFMARTKVSGVNDEQFYRDQFAKKIEEAKKDTRRYRVLKVSGTNSYIRYKQGDASPEAIQTTIDQMRVLSDFNNAGGLENHVTLIKQGSFSMERLFAANDPKKRLHGYSLFRSGKALIFANPDNFGVKPSQHVDGAWYRAGNVDAPDMLTRTLVHEYAHGWAIAILGQMLSGSKETGFNHHPRFLEFASLFPYIRGFSESHPISDIGFDNNGESFAEFFTAAFFQIMQANSLPDKKSELYEFMQFFSKYSDAGPVRNIRRGSFDMQEMATDKDLKFPQVYKGSDASNILKEFDARRDHYRNGLSPYATPINPKQSDIIKKYLAMLEQDEQEYNKTGSQDDWNYLVAGMSALKKFYDSLFFTYAKSNSVFDVKKISDDISTNEDTFRRWKDAKPSVGVLDSTGPFTNSRVSGTYTDKSGNSYPLVYLNSIGSDGKQTVVTVALDPKYANVDHSNSDISEILDHSVGMLIASSKGSGALTIGHVSVNGSHQRRGVATAMLAFGRGNTKDKISHGSKMTPDVSAWAQSVDKDLDNFTRKPEAFDDVYGTATQNRSAVNIIAKPGDTEQKSVSNDVLDAEAIFYAGESYGEFYHPDLQDYTSNSGGGLGEYKSTVGYVSAKTLSSMRGNEPDVPDSVKSKVEHLQSGEGFDQPVSVVYNPTTGEAYVADGNHRVEASIRAGVSHVPTRVFIIDSPESKSDNAKKLERDGGLPLPEGALEVHPYFVFNRNDLLTQDKEDSDSVIQEMASNQTIWQGKVNPTAVSPSQLPDPDNVFEQMAPGDFVMEKSTGKIYRVYNQNLEEVDDPENPGGKMAVATDKIVVRHLDGLLDNSDDVVTEFIGNERFAGSNVRTKRAGTASADGTYNDIRIYTDELRDPNDFINVNESFTKLSDQPITISDTMYVVQRETGIKGRVSGYVSEGVVRIDVLESYSDEDGPTYRQVEVPVSELLPIQNQRETLPGEDPIEHAPDMKPTMAVWDEVNRLSSMLYRWGYMSEDKFKAIQMSLHGRFLTRSGAEDLRRDLYNHDMIRRFKARKAAVVVESKQEVKAAPATPATPAASTSESETSTPGEKGKRSFEEQLLNLQMKRKAADLGMPAQEMAMPITKSQVEKGQPAPSRLAELERLLSEEGVISANRAIQILQSLPVLNEDGVQSMLDELRVAALNKRMANDQVISDIAIPDGYNLSKIENYVPRYNLDGSPVIQEMASPNAITEPGEGDELAEYEAPKVILNEDQQKAVREIAHAKGGAHFLTGKAGTGKSVTTRAIQREEERKGRNVIVMAPTGVAARNVDGVTINSAFNLPTDPLDEFDVAGHLRDLAKTKSGRKRIAVLKATQTFIIDEISMVRPDTIDAVDRILRQVKGNMSEPFGGAKVVMVGDMAQLPPVGVSTAKDPMRAQRFREVYERDYFFTANVWAASPFSRYELKKIMRQDESKDSAFVEALNNARGGRPSEVDIANLNEFAKKNAEEDAKLDEKDRPHRIVLVARNDSADSINKRGLDSLPGAAVEFEGQFEGENAERIFAESTGAIPEKKMQYKVGEPVMFVKNDDAQQRKSSGAADRRTQRWVNGTMGTITGFKTLNPNDGSSEPIKAILVEVDGKVHTVVPATWTNNEYDLERRFVDDKTLDEQVVTVASQTFTQMPLIPAWAITTHKSQGKTLPNYKIDYSDIINDEGKQVVGGAPFVAGQAYVALSRGTGSDSFTLGRPLRRSDFLELDPVLKDFMRSMSGDKDVPATEKSITEDFDPLKGFSSPSEIKDALDMGEIKGPNGETLTDYQANTIRGKIKAMEENPNSADRYRAEINKLMRSWFIAPGDDPESQEMAATKKAVEVDMNAFRDPSERQAVLDMLAKSGIPYNLRYDS